MSIAERPAGCTWKVTLVDPRPGLWWRPDRVWIQGVLQAALGTLRRVGVSFKVEDG